LCRNMLQILLYLYLINAPHLVCAVN
jgi:hypothetical protein